MAETRIVLRIDLDPRLDAIRRYTAAMERLRGSLQRLAETMEPMVADLRRRERGRERALRRSRRNQAARRRR